MNQIIDQKNAEYTEYINKHIQNVQESWKKLQSICPNEIFVTDPNLNKSITERTINHDSSKFNADEFSAYRRFFYPVSKEEKKKHITTSKKLGDCIIREMIIIGSIGFHPLQIHRILIIKILTFRMFKIHLFLTEEINE